MLFILDKPDGVKVESYIAVNETGNATLQCKGLGGNPDEYWYKWQHNGNDISEGENGIVELTFVNRNQSGNYTCSVHNIVGYATGSTTLDVHCKYDALY